MLRQRNRWPWRWRRVWLHRVRRRAHPPRHRRCWRWLLLVHQVLQTLWSRLNRQGTASHVRVNLKTVASAETPSQVQTWTACQTNLCRWCGGCFLVAPPPRVLTPSLERPSSSYFADLCCSSSFRFSLCRSVRSCWADRLHRLRLGRRWWQGSGRTMRGSTGAGGT